MVRFLAGTCTVLQHAKHQRVQSFILSTRELLKLIEFAVSQRILFDNIPVEQLERAFRNLIYYTLSELWSDGHLSGDRSVINTTIDDILQVDLVLAQVTLDSYSGFGLDMALQNLTNLPTSQTFNLSLVLGEYFDHKLQPDVEIYLASKYYTRKIVEFIDDLSKMPPTKANSYIIWTIVLQFIQDLGWKYVHIYRQFLDAIGQRSEEDTLDWCLQLSQSYLGEVLDSEYVATHLNQNNRNMTQQINMIIKDQLREQISSYSWFSEQEKAIAIEKLYSTKDKFGYSSGVLDSPIILDTKYNRVMIDPADHFGNLKRVLSFQQKLKAETVSEPINYDERWPMHVFTAKYDLNKWTGELFFPAGLLQHPIYDSRNPHYINVASLGRFIGLKTLDTIDDEYGKYIYPNYTYSIIYPWWSPEAENKFNLGPMNCTESLYEGKPWDPWMGINHTFGTGYLAERHMKELGALKAAHQAHKMWFETFQEPMLPGFSLDTVEQLFFLSYGQTFCFSRSRQVAESLYGLPDTIPEHLMLNTLLKSFPPFAASFHCPAASSRICESF